MEDTKTERGEWDGMCNLLGAIGEVFGPDRDCPLCRAVYGTAQLTLNELSIRYATTKRRWWHTSSNGRFYHAQAEKRANACGFAVDDSMDLVPLDWSI
jgi:hypothetical protein